MSRKKVVVEKGTLRRVLRLLAPYRLYLAGATAFAVGNVVLALAVPVLIGQAVDHIVGPDNVDLLH